MKERTCFKNCIKKKKQNKKLRKLSFFHHLNSIFLNGQLYNYYFFLSIKIPLKKKKIKKKTKKIY